MDINKVVNKITLKIKKNPLFYLLLFSLIIRLIYLLLNKSLWWDAHVYVGVGKYLYSGGKLGLWESFRPLIHSFIIGFFWKLGLNPLIIGKVLDIVFSLSAIWLTYLVGKKIFNKNVALVGALLLSLSPEFLMYSGMILTEPLGITLGMLGIYLYLLSKDITIKFSNTTLFFSGLFLALSFLTKFTLGIFFGMIIIIALFDKNKVTVKLKNLFILLFSFLLTITPYLYYNHILYSNAFTPFIEGSLIVATATWLYGQGVTYYFTQFFLMNPIYLFFFGYVYYFFKEKHWKQLKLVLSFLIPIIIIIYFMFHVPRKETRYLAIALPFLSLLVAYTIIKIYHKLKETSSPIIRAKSFLVSCSILVIITVLPFFLFVENVPPFEMEVVNIVNEKGLFGTIITTEPSLVSYLDNKLIILSGMDYAEEIYQKQKDYKLIYINDCELSCAPKDLSCSKNKEELFSEIVKDNDLVYQGEHRDQERICVYTIYLPKSELLKK